MICMYYTGYYIWAHIYFQKTNKNQNPTNKSLVLQYTGCFLSEELIFAGIKPPYDKKNLVSLVSIKSF